MYMSQYVLYALTKGTNNGVSQVGFYRPAQVLYTSNGLAGDSSATLTLQVQAFPGDSGIDTTPTGVAQANPTGTGAFPTGPAGTWCQAAQVAGFATPSANPGAP